VTATSLDRVLLVGFMGSGKTSVGRIVADRLGWRFLDFDDEIVREAGATIPELFKERGEPHFRTLEGRVAERLLAERAVVLGSGGGWGAVPDRLTSLPEGTESFWLEVSSADAIQRTSKEPGARPLLDRPDALREASQLLAERDPFYRQARWRVDTEHSSIEDVSARILEILMREYPNIFTE
jgi:shikimate kinase